MQVCGPSRVPTGKAAGLGKHEVCATCSVHEMRYLLDHFVVCATVREYSEMLRKKVGWQSVT